MKVRRFPEPGTLFGARSRALLVVAVWLVISPGGGRAHETPHEGAPEESSAEVGVTEHLGERVPLDLRFRDEEGRLVTLGDIVSGPTIMSLAYLGCTSICPQFLGAEAEALAAIPPRPGRDYRVLTVSFDERDTPEKARTARDNYLPILGESLSPDAWRFLTGDRQSIEALTMAAGFSFRREGDEFLHPVVLIVLSGDGTIVRYIYGKRFLPFDLRMALTEASEGRVGSSVNRVLLYCFRYDPDGKSYVLDTMRIFGVSTTLMAFLFFLYLVLGGKKRGNRR